MENRKNHSHDEAQDLSPFLSVYMIVFFIMTLTMGPLMLGGVDGIHNKVTESAEKRFKRSGVTEIKDFNKMRYAAIECIEDSMLSSIYISFYMRITGLSESDAIKYTDHYLIESCLYDQLNSENAAMTKMVVEDLNKITMYPYKDIAI